MILFPNAKINIGLFVTSKRTDGYHNLETVFLPVNGFCDVLEVIDNQKPEDEFLSTGIYLPRSNSDNLVLLALKKMRERANVPPLQIHLHKLIPLGAGLGGGSSDAAFMLRLLNEQYDVGLSKEELELMGKELGADCPVFIQNKPVLAKGIGNEFEDIALPLKGFWLQIVIPAIHITTVNAYSNITPKPPQKSLNDILKLPIEVWKENVYNDFEVPVFNKNPELEQIKKSFYANGAIFSLMSGSGSAIYGIFKEKPHISWDSAYTVHTEKIL